MMLFRKLTIKIQLNANGQNFKCAFVKFLCCQPNYQNSKWTHQIQNNKFEIKLPHSIIFLKEVLMLIF